MSATGTPASTELADLTVVALNLGDDALILAHQLGALLTRGPSLEEEVALANISLDLLGQARVLLDYAGRCEQAEVKRNGDESSGHESSGHESSGHESSGHESSGHDEDALAYLRDPDAFRCVRLVEAEDVDFAHTIVRQLAFSAWQAALYATLTSSPDPVFAGVAGKAVKEVAYHLDHAIHWTLRLGDGTDESHRRTQIALDNVWPLAADLFIDNPAAARLASAGIVPAAPDLLPRWTAQVAPVLAAAGLTAPAPAAPVARGEHLPRFAAVLTEMQSLHRAHAGASW